MGKLTDKDMDQLEKWISTGPKTFTLLYSITQDGCNGNTFHTKCNNQGPTVTVLYNQQGSVYGGYASVGWRNANGHVSDTSAFLYRLHFNGKPAPVQFGRTGNGNEVFDYQNHGPTFGNGYDLHTFSGAKNNAGGYYQLNGNMTTFGWSFNAQGQTAAQINNGNFIVTELEVYKVADGQRTPSKPPGPWRKTPKWNDKLLNRLIEDVIAYKGIPDVDIPEANVLMIGPVGAGKSSFYNTINSIFRDRITQRAGSGSAEQSLTTTYKQYRIRTQTGTTLNFRLCDTRGLEENQGIDILELNYLLEGHVPDFYQFNPASPITPDTAGYVKHPSAKDKIHCVAFVVDASTMDVIPAKVLQKLKSFQQMMNQRGIPQLVLLTKVDKLSTEVEADISQVFLSDTVRDEVDKVSQTLGLPRGNVLPVKNYENEMQLDENISTLALLALRQILNFAEDYMENLADKIAAEKKTKKYATKD